MRLQFIRSVSAGAIVFVLVVSILMTGGTASADAFTSSPVSRVVDAEHASGIASDNFISEEDPPDIPETFGQFSDTRRFLAEKSLADQNHGPSPADSEPGTPETHDFQRVGETSTNPAGHTPFFWKSLSDGISFHAAQWAGVPLLLPGEGVPVASGQGASGATRNPGMFFKGSYFEAVPVEAGRMLRMDFSGHETLEKTQHPDFGITKQDFLYAFSIGAGYAYNQDGFSFTPYVRADYSKAEIETGENTISASLLAAQPSLLTDGKDFYSESLSGVVGGQLEYSIDTGLGVFTPYFRMEWEHAFEEKNPHLIQARILGDAGYAAFGDGTTEPGPADDSDRSFFNLGLGLSTVFPQGIIAFFDYETILGIADLENHQVLAGMRFEF